MRLAIVSSHPIQYNAPLFACLAQHKGMNLRVFYSWRGTADQADPEFGQPLTWDIPLLQGYDHRFVRNVSKDPGTHHFGGLDSPELPACIDEWGPDALLVYGWPFKAHLAALRHFHGRVPVFFRGDSTLASGKPGLRKLLRKAGLSWVYGHVDHALFVGNRNRAYFLQHGLREQQLHWVPHSIDNRRFSDDDDARRRRAESELRRLGIPGDGFTVLFAGKFVSRKMPLTLIEAVIELNQRAASRPVHVVFVGDGPLRPGIEQAASRHSCVHVIGFRNQQDMPWVYRMGDVFVLPSSTETWGLAVNEAFACSRPAVVSDRVGCAPDLVKCGETGFVFECGNAQDLAEKLKRFRDEPGLSLRMGANAARLIEDWSMEKAATRMATVIQNQLAVGKPH